MNLTNFLPLSVQGTLPPFTRPWQSPVPPLTCSVSEDVPFPTDEEDDGMVRLAWRGPSALDRCGFTAMGVLLEYLTDTPVAPLQRELVEAVSYTHLTLPTIYSV